MLGDDSHKMQHFINNQPGEAVRRNSNQEKSSKRRKPRKTETEDFNCDKKTFKDLKDKVTLMRLGERKI